MQAAIVEREEQGHAIAPVPTANPAMDMIRDALARGESLDTIRELRVMSKDIAAEQATMAFNAAFAAFKGEVVKVDRTRKVTDGPLKGRSYAELFSFVDAATPALSKHGLSASWAVTKDEKDWIEVTCTLEHALGGKKQVSQGGPPDAGGAKNALQARISTVTYLERATFKAICGLAEQGDDDDGAGGAKSGAVISDEQLKKLQTLASEVGGDVARLCKHFGISALPDLPVAKLAEAIGIMEIKRQQAPK